jgi:hypothetical protein
MATSNNFFSASETAGRGLVAFAAPPGYIRRILAIRPHFMETLDLRQARPGQRSIPNRRRA